MKWSIVLMVGLGLVAALAAAMLAAGLRASPQVADSPPQVRFMVAARDLPALTAVDADAVEAVVTSESDAPSDRLVHETAVIGRVLAVPLKAGQLFTERSFVADGSGQSLVSTIPAGMRAVSVSLRPHASMAGMLSPGSRVDVIVSFSARNSDGGQAVSNTLLQNIQVLAIDSRTVGSGDADAADRTVQGVNYRPMITLLVTPEQAQKLQLAIDTGEIALMMRNPRHGEMTLIGETSLADLRVNLFGSGEPVQAQPDEPIAQAPTRVSRQQGVDVIRGGVRTTEIVRRID